MLMDEHGSRQLGLTSLHSLLIDVEPAACLSARTFVEIRLKVLGMQFTVDAYIKSKVQYFVCGTVLAIGLHIGS